MKINQVFNLILGFLQEWFNKKAIKESFSPPKLSNSNGMQFHKQMMFRMNIGFNQRKSKIPKVAREGQGIESYLRKAQGMVMAQPDLISNSKDRARFLKQKPNVVAKYLCNSIAKYCFLVNAGVSMPGIELVIIRAVNDGGLVWSGGMFAKQVERNFMAPYCDYKASLKFDYSARKGMKPAQMLAKFQQDPKWWYALVRIQTGRKKWQGHTFTIVKNDAGEIIMYDSYHTHWSGVPLEKRKCKITNVYKFVI